MSKLLAFHNDQSIKDKYLARVRAHALADELVKGQYWRHGKGCAVGCTIHSNSHLEYEVQLGIPMLLARLEDSLFENLPNRLAQTWPERFLTAPRIGAELDAVWPKFARWLMIDPEHGVLNYVSEKYMDIRRSINIVADLYSNGWPSAARADTANSAANAAYSAAAAAFSAAAAAANSAAAAAANSAADAAYSAAAATYSAAAAYSADADARSNQYVAMSDKLIQLMSNA